MEDCTRPSTSTSVSESVVKKSSSITYTTTSNGRISERNNNSNQSLKSIKNPQQNFKEKEKENEIGLVWRNVFLFIYIHAAALFGLYLLIFGHFLYWKSILWMLGIAIWGGLGITAGAHRLWAHRAYKAKWPLRLFLCIGQTIALQNSIHEWCRDHRSHHKFSETDADPHNATRGFFFAHMGWLCCRKHDDVRIKGKTVQLDDLEADPIVMIQKKFYVFLVGPACFLIPALVPWYFWGETFFCGWFICANLRYVLSLHGTWLVNSAAHLWGQRPYDKSINPSENLYVAIFAFGEGWHNYHHVFPWDYRASETGLYQYNPTTIFINFCAFLGQAYDMKSVPRAIVHQRVLRTGHEDYLKTINKTKESKGQIISGPWGWGDMDIPEEDARLTQTLFPKDH